MVFGKMPVVVSPGLSAQMKAAPINPDWVLIGKPLARSAALSNSIDCDAFTCLWDCTAGTFLWNFSCDETVHILDGEVVITWNGADCVLKTGDTAYFPAGSQTKWHVESYVRKVAFLREPAPRLISFSLRVWRKLRLMTFGGQAASAGLAPQTN